MEKGDGQNRGDMGKNQYGGCAVYAFGLYIGAVSGGSGGVAGDDGGVAGATTGGAVGNRGAGAALEGDSAAFGGVSADGCGAVRGRKLGHIESAEVVLRGRQGATRRVGRGLPPVGVFDGLSLEEG